MTTAAGVIAAASPSPAWAEGPPAPGAPAIAPIATAAAPVYDPAWARVRIFSRDPKVTLERRVGSLPSDTPGGPRSPYDNNEFEWKVVCATPCNAALQVAGEYRVAGEGVTPSTGFAVHAQNTHLLVDPGSWQVRRAGVYLAVIGFVGAAAAGIFLGVEAERSSSGPAITGSVAGLVSGGVIGITGLGLVMAGGTSVHDEAHRELALLPSPRPSMLHATFRF